MSRARIKQRVNRPLSHARQIINLTDAMPITCLSICITGKRAGLSIYARVRKISAAIVQRINKIISET